MKYRNTLLFFLITSLINQSVYSASFAEIGDIYQQAPTTVDEKTNPKTEEYETCDAPQEAIPPESLALDGAEFTLLSDKKEYIDDMASTLSLRSCKEQDLEAIKDTGFFKKVKKELENGSRLFMQGGDSEYCEFGDTANVAGEEVSKFGVPDIYKKNYINDKTDVNCRCVFQRYWHERAIVNTNYNLLGKKLLRKKNKKALDYVPDDLTYESMPNLDKSGSSKRDLKKYKEMTYHNMGVAFKKKLLNKMALKTKLLYSYNNGEWQMDQTMNDKVCTSAQFENTMMKLYDGLSDSKTNNGCDKSKFMDNFGKYFGRKQAINQPGEFRSRNPGKKQFKKFIENFKKDVFETTNTFEDKRISNKSELNIEPQNQCINKLEFMHFVGSESVLGSSEHKEALGLIMSDKSQRDRFLLNGTLNEGQKSKSHLYYLINANPVLKEVLSNDKLYAEAQKNYNPDTFLKDADKIATSHLNDSCTNGLEADLKLMMCNDNELEIVNYNIGDQFEDTRSRKNFQYHYCEKSFPYLRDFERPTKNEVNNYLTLGYDKHAVSLKKSLNRLAQPERPSQSALIKFIARKSLEGTQNYGVTQLQGLVDADGNPLKGKAKRDAETKKIQELLSRKDDILATVVDKIETKDKNLSDRLRGEMTCEGDIKKEVVEQFQKEFQKELEAAGPYERSVQIYQALRPDEDDMPLFGADNIRATEVTNKKKKRKNKHEKLRNSAFEDMNSGICNMFKSICAGGEQQNNSETNILKSCLSGSSSANEMQLRLKCLEQCAGMAIQSTTNCSQFNMSEQICKDLSPQQRAMFSAVITSYTQRLEDNDKHLEGADWAAFVSSEIDNIDNEYSINSGGQSGGSNSSETTASSNTANSLLPANAMGTIQTSGMTKKHKDVSRKAHKDLEEWAESDSISGEGPFKNLGNAPATASDVQNYLADKITDPGQRDKVLNNFSELQKEISEEKMDKLISNIAKENPDASIQDILAELRKELKKQSDEKDELKAELAKAMENSKKEATPTINNRLPASNSPQSTQSNQFIAPVNSPVASAQSQPGSSPTFDPTSYSQIDDSNIASESQNTESIGEPSYQIDGAAPGFHLTVDNVDGNFKSMKEGQYYEYFPAGSDQPPILVTKIKIGSGTYLFDEKGIVVFPLEFQGKKEAELKENHREIASDKNPGFFNKILDVLNLNGQRNARIEELDKGIMDIDN